MPEAPRPPSWITDPLWRARYSRWAAAALRAFHRYAHWLVSLSWWRFGLYALALLIAMNVVQGLFTSKVVEYVETVPPRSEPPKPPPLDTDADTDAQDRAEDSQEAASAASGDFEVRLGRDGVRVGPVGAASDAAMVDISPEGIRIRRPAQSAASAPPATDSQPPASDALRQELQAKTEALHQAAELAKQHAEAAKKALKDIKAQRSAWEETYKRELHNWERRQREVVKRTRVEEPGALLFNLAVLWVLFSAIVKATYKGRQEAEAKAAAAEETAEAEALKRQLVEARLSTMQAQVEPHFLFNTLASIDHLIETDPKRASQMQKNLIALLRASMPTMRETNGGGLRDLRREMAVVRPYLEILQVRMEERLSTHIDVPEGLLSAQFPPMIIQGLVENAIKHGLEPKPEGGDLRLSARVEHGKLVVEVADTGLGFGRADTQGTGVGLANTRERLQLLYGNKASLTVAQNQPCGTLIRISVPYRANESDSPTDGGV